jgi:hypothetical protein
MNAKEMASGGVDWIRLAQNRDYSRAVVDAILKLLGSIECGKFLDYFCDCCLLKKDSVSWS